MVTVRRMVESDLARVSELSGELGYPTPVQALRARFEAITSDSKQALFVAEAAQRVIGWIHVHPVVLLESDPYAEVGGLVVGADARRTGAGRALVGAAESFAAASGAMKMRVRSNIKRVEAHEFYPALGYLRFKTQHNYEKVLRREV